MTTRPPPLLPGTDQPKLRVFISYSWRNVAGRDKLIGHIRSGQHEAVYDAAYLNGGERLTTDLVRLLSTSDVLVVLFTPEAAESPAVLEELTRAHSSFVKIYALVHADAAERLPWFLSQTLFYRYSCDASLEVEIRRLLESLSRDREHFEIFGARRGVREHLFVLQRATKESRKLPNLMRAKQEMIGSVIAKSLREARSLCSTQYDANIGSGTHFLVRARPIFRNATHVYAVSVDSVSTFWTSKHTSEQQLAREYLKTQPRSTRRLFVFSTPEEAHNYSTMLNIHNRWYGQEGRVLVCSSDAYKNLLQRLGIEDGELRLLQVDFAVLEYAHAGASLMLRATLNGDRFRVTMEDDVDAIPTWQQFRDFVRGLDRLTPGELDLDTGIMCWKTDLQADLDGWSERLKSLFSARQPDWFHFVFFSEQALRDAATREKLTAILRRLRSILEGINDTEPAIRLKDFWFGEAKADFAPTNQGTGGPIHHESKQFPYMLMMRFDDQASLAGWYSHAEHHRLRHEVYSLFGADVGGLVAEVDALAASAASNIVHRYETIEQGVRAYLTRRDYVQADTIDDLVRRRPFRPKIDFSPQLA